MPNNQTKALVQGSMMIAIFTMLMLISFYVPFALMVALPFSPLPIAWYSANYKRSSSIIIAAIGCIFSVLAGGLIALLFAPIMAVLGVVIGDAIRLNKSKLYLFMSSGIAVLLSSASVYLCYMFFAGINVVQIGLELARKSYEESIELTKGLPNQLEITSEQLDIMFNTMELTVPATVTITAFLVAFIVVTVNLPVLKRLGLAVPKFAPFQEMRLPRAVLWYYMVILSINLFVRPEAGSMLDVIVLNISYILWLLLILQGISLIHYFIASKGMPNVVKWVATILAIPLSSFIILLGIIDLGFDVRSLVKGKTKE